MDKFEFEWECPGCGNTNIGNITETEDFSVCCDECDTEYDVCCEIQIRVSSVTEVGE